MKKRILSIVLTLCMVLMLMPQVAFAADTAKNIPYLDASGTQQTCQSATVVTSEDTTWGDDGNEGWYVVKSDVTIGTSETPQRVTVTGDVHLILVDDCTLTVNGGIQVQDYDNNFENGCSNSLTIYGQTDSTGTLIAQNAKLYNAAIGGDSDSINNGSRGGDITINGGIVNATSKSGAGIGGSGTGPDTGGSGGTVIINGGIVTATSVRGAAIGGGCGDVGGNGGITIINGGIVNATSKLGANIGGGHGGFEAADSNGTLHISKGVVFMGSGGYVYGSSVTLGTNFTIPDDKTLTIKDMQRLTIPENVTLTNNGTIYNYGTIYNNGTIINNGTINGTVSGNQPVETIDTNYLDENGEEKSASCRVINTDNIDSFNTLTHDWYMVAGTVTANKRITISGTVNLILADGCNFTVNGGIEVIHLDCLRVYAQSTGDNMGKLTANTIDGDNAGIGGSVGYTGGFISIIGGNVTAESTNGAGIGGGAGEYHDGVYNGGDGRGVSIIGGNVKAISQYGAGIGGGSGSKGNGGSGGEVIISGGNVTAESTNGAGIGGGGVEDSNGSLSGGNGGSVTINGGTVTATSTSGAGIGGGSGSRGNGGNCGQVTLSGGTVTATSRNGKGIGGGSGYQGNQVGGSGIFQTDNGNAVVFASSIAYKTNQSNWNGVIFEGNAGMVYGTSVIPIMDFTIDGGKTLFIPESSALTISDITAVNNGSVYVDGTVSGLGGDLYYPLTVDGGTADKTYTYKSKSYGKVGEPIALTGTDIPEGQKATWTSTPSVEISDGSFIMPNNALNVTAQWVDCPHTGDKETRNEKAATCTEEGYTGDTYCKVCKKEISKGAAINMLAHKLDNIPATDATVTETGNKEYWHCKDCENNFSDAAGTNEITDLESWKTGGGLIDKLPPEIIEGKGQSITAGDKKDLTFRSNAAFSDFIRVELDGKTLDAKNYTVKEGSTIVTLKADYVATLSAGDHTIGIVSTSGTAVTTFTVAELQKPTGNNSSTGSVNHVPQTGDATNLALWIILSFVSGILLSVLGIYGKKKKHNR